MSSEKSPGNHAAHRPRLQLSSVQILASALAAVTATIAGSFLGVNGTVIGAAIASVLTVTANAIYAHSLRRTGERVRSAAPVARVRPISRNAPVDGPAVTRPLPVASSYPEPAVSRPRTDRPSRQSPGYAWRRLGIATVAVFVCVLTLLTGIELVSGRPVSDLLRGTSGSGTTVFGASSRDSATTTPAPQPAVTVTRTVLPTIVTTTPTVTQTAPAVTVTPTPTATGSSAPKTPSPSGSAPGGPTP